VFVKKKLPEQLGLHCYAISTHPVHIRMNLSLTPPLKKSWIHLCKGSLYISVAGVLLHETVERTHLGR